MTHKNQFRLTAAAVILLAITALTMADEAESLEKLKAEKASLEKRLAEINLRLGVTWLGMTLVDPTEQLMKQYELPKEYPGPIIAQVQDPSHFPAGMAPSAGCAFWIVEHPAHAFLFNKERSPSHWPMTVRQLAQAILSCTVTPEEHQKLINQTAQECREHAEALKENPAERDRLLEIAERVKMPKEDVGLYICRVVYHYPKDRGTMTTYIRMSKEELDQLRELLKK